MTAEPESARAAAAGGSLTIRLKQKPKSVLTAGTAAGLGWGGGGGFFYSQDLLVWNNNKSKQTFLMKATPMKRSPTKNLWTNYFACLFVFF